MRRYQVCHVLRNPQWDPKHRYDSPRWLEEAVGSVQAADEYDAWDLAKAEYDTRDTKVFSTLLIDLHTGARYAFIDADC